MVRSLEEPEPALVQRLQLRCLRSSLFPSVENPTQQPTARHDVSFVACRRCLSPFRDFLWCWVRMSGGRPSSSTPLTSPATWRGFFLPSASAAPHGLRAPESCRGWAGAGWPSAPDKPNRAGCRRGTAWTATLRTDAALRVQAEARPADVRPRLSGRWRPWVE